MSLIPAGSRPYIGSTLGNDPWEMVFGYNGLGRFGSPTGSADYLSFAPAFSGEPGVLRLFNAQLAGQIAWLIPAALVALVVLWILRFPRPLTVLLTVWTLTFLAMFSVVTGMHQFYTAALAVPFGLTVAAAVVWSARRNVIWPTVAIVAVAAVTAVAIGFSVGGYSIPVALAQAVVAIVAILLLLGRHRSRVFTTAAMVVALLLTPAVWSAVTIAHPSSINPVAGGVPEMGDAPAALGGTGGSGGLPSGSYVVGPAGTSATVAPDGAAGAAGTSSSGATTTYMSGPGGPGGPNAGAELASWLEAHRGNATHLAAAFGGMPASSLIVASKGQSVLPIGGFGGSDAAPTLEQFISLVRGGEVRYVVDGGTVVVGPNGTVVGPDPNTPQTVQQQIRSWVEKNCTMAPDAPAPVFDCA